MIKILFLLTLIYFTNCDSECVVYDGDPINAKECISLQADENKMCCMLVFKCENDPKERKMCTEEDKDFNMAARIEFEESDNPSCENIKANFICHENEVNNSSYLKIGIFLILGLLF